MTTNEEAMRELERHGRLVTIAVHVPKPPAKMAVVDICDTCGYIHLTSFDCQGTSSADADTTEMYYKYCAACDCYEYDCHGLEGCIMLGVGYLNPRVRADMRRREKT